MEKLLYGVREAQEQLSIGRSKLYELMLSKDLEAVKIGRRSLITASSMEQYVEKLRQSNE